MGRLPAFIILMLGASAAILVAPVYASQKPSGTATRTPTRSTARTPTRTPRRTPTATATLTADFANPQRVTIAGYAGQAMEPFITRDGSMLFFNDSNQGPVTRLYWSRRINDLAFQFEGQIGGVNTSSLDAVASMDRSGNFYFISPRSYPRTFSTIYRGVFARGAVPGVNLVPGVSRDQPGWVNFDAEISADGGTLYFVDSYFGTFGQPQNASIVIARRHGNGFVRAPDSDVIMREIDTNALNYAPDTSADQREIFFTRLDPDGPAIYRASRASTSIPFGKPAKIDAITGFAEGPSISPDGRSLYYHHRDSGVFHIYRVTR